MIKKFIKLFSRSWFSCERYSERASCKLDNALTFRDQLGYRFHYLICYTCRQVEKHWIRMQEDLSKLPEEFESEKLSKAKAAEICEALTKARLL